MPTSTESRAGIAMILYCYVACVVVAGATTISQGAPVDSDFSPVASVVTIESRG